MSHNLTKLKHRFPFKQLRRLPRHFSHTWPIFLLIFFSLTLAFLNFTPHTTLSGWDNLHPELAPLLNLKRAFFAVWQEYQSLGLLGGMAHAADLPRAILVYLLSLTSLPTYLYRYLWTFASLILGPLGVYFFIDSYLLKNKFASQTTKIAGFLGGLYYLLNLSTIQVFYTPFETFTAFYAFLPWLLYFLLKHLNHPSLKNTWILFVVSFFAAPSFYVETLFVVFLLFIFPFFLETIKSHKHFLPELKIILKTTTTFLAPHLFWLLPVAFFVFTNGAVGETAKINTIATPETIERNLSYAKIKNLALLKGFWFSFTDYTGSGQFDYLLSTWRQHLSTPSVAIIGYLIFSTILVGLYYSYKKRLIYSHSLIYSLLICYFFLLGGNLFLSQKLPLVNELFRSPFTKFSIPLSFIYANFFAVGTIFILDLFTYLHSSRTYFATTFTIILSLIIFTSPAFAGHLISPNLRVQIPVEYTKLQEFFANQEPSTRIANFPQSDFWGWYYYHWGYRGSGFLWYGLPQSILDRTFDVWSHSSEKYYEDINTALYSDNFDQFDQTISDYAVNFVLVDSNLVSANPLVDNHNQKLLSHLQQSNLYTLALNLSNSLFVYQLKNPIHQNYLSTTQTLPPTKIYDSSLPLRPITNLSLDSEYLHLPEVTLEPNTELNLPSFTDIENQVPVSVSYQKTGNQLNFKITPLTPQITLGDKDITPKIQPSYFVIPDENYLEELIIKMNDQYYHLVIPAEISDFDDQPLFTTYLPTNQIINIFVYDGSLQSEINLTSPLELATPYQCYTDKPDRQIEKINSPQGISLYGTDVVGCLSTPLPEFNQEGLISATFSFSSPTQTLANLNITDSDLNTTTQTQPLATKSKPQRANFYTTISSKPQQLNLILEANNTTSTQEITYSNIRLNYHPLVGQTATKLNYTSAQTITIDSTQTLKTKIPVISSSLDITQTSTENQLFPQARNCDQFNEGLFLKQTTDEGLLYTSQNANSCDFLTLRQLPHDLNYFLSFDLTHNQGLLPTICLENNQTHRCDIYERLVSTSKTQLLLNPVSNPNEITGYTLHLFNQSLNNKVTQNLLNQITLHPIPLNFLKSITTAPINNLTETGSTIITSKHPAEFIYTASITNNTPTYLNLYQEKNPYWYAFEISEKEFSQSAFILTTKSFFYFLNQNKLIKLDNQNWFNQFELPTGNHHLLIIYLPQHLEFLGFLLSSIFKITLIYFTILKINKTSKKHLSKRKKASI